MSTGQIIQADLNLASPSAPADAATKSYVDAAVLNAVDNKAFKFPVRCAVTSKNVGDLTFSSFNSGTNVLTTTASISTIDGITLAVNDRVLINSFLSTNRPYNGIYTYTSLTGTAQFTRASDANTTSTGNWTDLIVGSTVVVEDGTMNTNTMFILQPSSVGTDTLTLNTTNLVWLSPGAAVPTWYQEVPTGTVNGTNAVFTLAHTPIANSLIVMLRRQIALQGTDYTLSSATVTFNAANISVPATGNDFVAMYQA